MPNFLTRRQALLYGGHVAVAVSSLNISPDLALLLAQINGGGKSAQLPPASHMKMIGLIGGTSWYSTVDYYRYINEAVNDAYGNNTNPPLIL